jgi:hypothetical protein
MAVEASTFREAAVTDALLAALVAARHRAWPFDYWTVKDALSAKTAKAVCELPFAPPGGAAFDGRREANNSARVFFTPQIQARHAVCRELAEAFGAPRVIAALEALTGTWLAGSRLRIEYCQDVDGFWLEPHRDIAVKRFTMLIYLSDEPGLADAGTDLYDGASAHRPVGRSDYARGAGLIFIPGEHSWHGFTRRPIRGVRKTLIVNYVGEAWRAVEELA